jgi:hypothetical protein
LGKQLISNGRRAKVMLSFFSFYPENFWKLPI